MNDEHMPFNLRSAISEAAANASRPGANLTRIVVELEAYYRMVMAAYPDAEALQAIYWTMINYIPPATSAASPVLHRAFTAKGRGYTWKPGYTAGM